MACIVEFNINFLRFLSKFGMNLQQSRDSECGDATYHNPNKKWLYPKCSCSHPAAIPGIIMPSAIKAVQMA